MTINILKSKYKVLIIKEMNYLRSLFITCVILQNKDSLPFVLWHRVSVLKDLIKKQQKNQTGDSYVQPLLNIWSRNSDCPIQELESITQVKEQGSKRNIFAAVTWLEYCRYCVKPKTINQSWCMRLMWTLKPPWWYMYVDIGWRD